ncbi:hypothetical protein [Mycolicibacterium parafortuitum]|uniref:Secreted protein n=1 Tax=Mycolicibacterium parafortuitum TaxID=39692 RepID=A0A375YH42_MYCPF|nr:hypothetical protein [Mycolicibacterium parafortuitum]ORB28777.1 hypothetical protein BST38_19000 [Mycolicibacterium parafortuitum]SRX80438.1 hypothetical protein MPP7335_02181 [Mycolicibacterium parafortuitum]
MSFVKNAAAGAVFGGSLLFTAGLGMAQAQPVDTPDGLVNLSVGDVTLLQGVTADTAATAASALCGVEATDVSALAGQVDDEGTAQTVCSGLPGGDLVVAQNATSAESAPADEGAAEDSESGSATQSPTGSGEGFEPPAAPGSEEESSSEG